MVIKTYYMNNSGLEYLATELSKRVKQFVRTPLDAKSGFDRGMLRAWAAQAEERLNSQEAPEVEIRSFDTVSGHTELVRLESAHFDLVLQEIEE